MRRMSRFAGVVVSLLVLGSVGRAEDRNVLVLDGKVFGVRTQPLTTGLNISSFVFSPDGRQIAFINLRMPTREQLGDLDRPGQPFNPESMRALFQIRLGVISMASARVQFLVTLPDPVPGAQLVVLDPQAIAWSYDSRFVVVQAQSVPFRPADERPLDSLLVVETATGKSSMSLTYNSLSGAAWHPRERLLAFSATADAVTASDEIFLWDPMGSGPSRLARGSMPRWTDDGWVTLSRMPVLPAGRVDADGPEAVEINPMTGEERPGKQSFDVSPLVLARWSDYAVTRRAEGKGYRIRQEASGPNRGAITVEPVSEGDARPASVIFRQESGARLDPFALSPDGVLVAPLARRDQRQPLNGAFKLDVRDLWVMAPLGPPMNNMAWLATFKPAEEMQIDPWPMRWAADSRHLAFLADGNLSIASIEDWSNRPIQVINGEVIDFEADRRTVMSNLRQIALAALMFAEDHDDRLPDASRFRDDIRPFLRNDSVYGRPREAGSDLLEWLALSGFALHDIPRPAQTPLGLIAWPPGEVQVAFVDGHVKTFTADAWAQFVQQARAEGWWPTGW